MFYFHIIKHEFKTGLQSKSFFLFFDFVNLSEID